MMPRDLLAVPDTGTALPEQSQNDPAPRQPRDLLAPQSPTELIPAGMRAYNERAARVKAAYDAARGRDPDVDYDMGLKFMDRAFLDAMDNNEERKAFLTKKYGAASVGQDSGGTPYLIQNGKKISTEGGSFWSGMAADVVGNMGVMGGSGLGAIGGGAVGGPPGAIVGAGLGAAAGKGAQEAVKAATGTLKKTPGEEESEIATTGALGAAGEAGGALVGRRMARGLIPEPLGGQTPASRAMTDTVLSKGGVPPMASALPSSRILQRHMEMADRLVGAPKGMEAANFAMVRNEVRTMLEKSGVPPDKIDAAMAQVMDPTARLSTTDLGRDIQQSVRAHIKTVQDAADNEIASANKQLNAQLTHLDTLTRRYKPGDLGVDVASGIIQARKDFGTASDKIYSRIDKLVGDKPVVPTFLVKRQAKALLEKLPESDAKAIVKEIAAMPTTVSFENMQRLRSRLYEIGEPSNLAASGILKHDIRNMRTAVDQSFGQAFLGKSPEAAKMLRAADEFYADGIKKFNDITINTLVKQAENGVPVDPSQVAKFIIKPGNVARVETIKKMLPPEVWKRVMGADFDNIISASTRTVDGHDVVSGKLLQKELRKRGNLVTVTYGPNIANIGRQFADRLAARDGDIPAANLTMDNFSATMMKAEAANNYLDAFLGKNYLSELAKPTFSPDAAFNWIVKPGHEAELEQAISQFGATSPIVAGIRQAAVKDLLSRAVVETETGTATTIAGPAIEKALSAYTKKQQDLLFPGGLADDMRLLAKEVKFVFPENVSTRGMTGMAAGAVMSLGPLVRWPMQAYSGAWQWMLTRPNVVKMLAAGLKSYGDQKTIAQQTTRAIFRAAALGETPEEGDEQ
jgi:hypothetical protein